MSTYPKVFQKFYSELVLVSVIFLFFLELISDFVESVYALCLLTLSLNENVLSVLFLFSPLLLFFFRKGFSDRILVIVGELMIICRVLEALLVNITQARMLVAGIGVGCFLIYFPMFLQRKYKHDEEQSGLTLGLGLTFGLALSVFFRTLGSTIDISTYNWFQSVGWILALIATFMLFGMITTQPKETMDDSTSIEHPVGTLKTIALTLGLIGILIMIYYSFSSPTVISRWTEGDYFLILLLIILMLTFFLINITYRPTLIAKMEPWMIWIWNAIFVVSLVLTILLNQIQFPSSVDKYPVEVPITSVLHQVPLLLLLISFPIILIDFTLISRELINKKPSMGKLAGSFTLGSFFFLVMIFANAFTTVYDYIDVVGPLFRDMYWFVYLVVGLSACLPILLVKKGVFTFKKPVVGLQSRIISIAIISVAIGTLLGAVITSPIPISPEVTTSLTVMTYNIRQGYSEYGKKNFDGQLEVIKGINPDIIGLQECDISRISGGNADIVRYFANNLRMHSYYGPKTVTGTFGIALLSKYPIENTRTFFMYSKGEQTATIEAQIQAGTSLFNVYVTHLGNDGPLVQQEAIVKRITGKSNIILLGDFNFRPGTQQYYLTTQILNDSWLYASTANIVYLDELEYNISRRIDHIFVSPGTSVSECYYIISTESDHPAVWAKIEL